MRTFLRSLFRPARPIRRQKPKGLTLAIEHLEARQLMAAGLDVSFDLADRLLRVQATPEADHIQIVNNAGQISVADHSIRIIDGDTEYQADALDVTEISQAMVLDLGADDVLDVVEQDVAPEMALALAVFNAAPAVDVHATAVAIDEQLGLHSNGDLWENWGGAGDKWMQGAGGEWYFILPDGGLYAWDGSAGANGALVAQLDEAHYIDPVLVFDAYQPIAEEPQLTYEEELNQVLNMLEVTTDLPITSALVNLPRNTYEVQVTYGQNTNLTAGIGVTSSFSAIDKKYKSLGGASGFLGQATSSTQKTADGVLFRHYQGGSIYWTGDTGAVVVRGAIRDKFLELGAPGFLGLPVRDTVEVRAGVFMSEFLYGNIYWSAETGAHEVHGLIAANYKFIGGPNSALGLPTSDELPLANGGRYSLFQNGAMYWTPAGGVRMVQGAIGAKYLSLGGPDSFLGIALTNELTAPDGVGKYTHFQNGSIYWSPSTGAHVVYGAIRDLWAGMGWEQSLLGYPTSDEYSTPTPDERMSSFEGGSIVWDGSQAHVSISRDEMLRLFARMGRDGVVDNDELVKAIFLIADPSVRMPEHVRNLAGKVINGDLANAMVQGQAVGNLYAGSSAWQLQMLVDKWFRGTDLPNASGADGTVYGYLNYLAGDLFRVGGPTLADIDQGDTGDCYFLSALGAVLERDPQLIRDMFIDNGDGTYTVRFFRDVISWDPEFSYHSQAEYVTVNRFLPVDATGPAFAAVKDCLWVALAEKAYVQMNESGWLNQEVAANSYQAISSGNPAAALHQITNRASGYHSVEVWNIHQLVQDVLDGRMIVLGTEDDPDDLEHPTLLPDHMYVVVGLVNGGFQIYNPYGDDGDDGSGGDGYLVVSSQDVIDNFTTWFVC